MLTLKGRASEKSTSEWTTVCQNQEPDTSLPDSTHWLTYGSMHSSQAELWVSRSTTLPFSTLPRRPLHFLSSWYQFRPRTTETLLNTFCFCNCNEIIRSAWGYLLPWTHTHSALYLGKAWCGEQDSYLHWLLLTSNMETPRVDSEGLPQTDPKSIIHHGD